MMDTTVIRSMLLVACAAPLGTGCAAFLNQGRAQDEKQIAQMQQAAERETTAINVGMYADEVAAHAKANPTWDNKSHVARLEQLLARVKADADASESQYKKTEAAGLGAKVRLAARDVPGAGEIYEGTLQKGFDGNVFDQYLAMLKDYGGEARIPEQCQKFYASTSDEILRFNCVVTTCREKLSSNTSDGLDWLPAQDAVKVRDEFVIKTAEMMDVQGGLDRQKARKDGRLFTASYRGLVKIQVRSQCPRSVYLAYSATARGELGKKHEIHGNSLVNAVELPVDHFLWLLAEDGHRISVARVSTWDNGLLVNQSCTDIIPMQ